MKKVKTMNKYLLLALTLILPLSANAVEMWEGETAQLDCTAPTTYVDGTPIEASDTITFKLYQDGGSEVLTEAQCSFTVSPPAGDYIYRATAVSAKYGNESLPSNDLVVNIVVKKRLMSPVELRATVLPSE